MQRRSSRIFRSPEESGCPLRHSIPYRNVNRLTAGIQYPLPYPYKLHGLLRLLNQLLCISLEVTVLASVFHSCNRAHAAVYLILTSLIQFKCSRALIASCKDASHHTHASACCDRLCNITGIFDTAISNDRDAVLFLRLRSSP